MNPPSLPTLYDWAPAEIAIEYAAFDLARAGLVHRNGAGWVIDDCKGSRYANPAETAGIERYEARAAAALAYFTA